MPLRLVRRSNLRYSRLTVGDDRTLQTRTLDVMEVTEGAQPIGVVLEGSPKDGMIWVLVNPQ